MLDPDSFVDETVELIKRRAIWEVLHEHELWVIIPFSERIRFHAISNRRNPDMLYDLIKSHALLFFLQREQKTSSDGMLCVYANVADFTAANDVFTLLNGTAGGQESKMTKKESDLLGTIQKAGQLEFTIQDLQRFTGWSYSSIYKTVKGYDSRGKNYTGLLEKCPALSFTDRTVTVTEHEGYAVRRRTEAFEWDKELYRQWNGGGSCWLDRDPKDGDGSFAALLHVSCNFAATAANGNGVPGASVSCNGIDIDNNIVLREDDLLQNRNYTATQQPDMDATQCLRNSQFAANENRSPPKPAGSENIAPHHPPIDCCNCSKPAANVQQTTAPAAKQDRTIRARDYKTLDPPEPKTVCYFCGKKGSWYVEKLTAERKARPKEQQDARRSCAKRATRAAVISPVKYIAPGSFC